MPFHHTPFKPILHYYFALLGAVLLLSPYAPAKAQGGGVDTAGTGGRHGIQGRLIFPSGQRADLRLKVRLESTGGGDLTVLSNLNGNFAFQSLRPGNYTVVVEGGEFYETVRESVFIESATISGRRMPATIAISRPFNVQIYLRPKPNATNKPAVVLVALAKVPKPSVDLYLRALDSSAKGDVNKAIEQLKQALALYPGFPLALNELGVQYLKLADLDRAAEVLRSSVALAPDEYQPRINYGIALLNQRRFNEAQTQFSEALKRNPSTFTAHMYLGITLISLKNYKEAEAELQTAITLGRDRVGQAHYYLGGLYWRAKDYKRAALQLEKYLELEPEAADAARIRLTIKDLHSKQ